MITKRDKEIVRFVEMHGSITINQCAKVFFAGNKEAYDQARKRLQIIYKEGLLKRFRKDPKSQAVYYIDRKLKTHDLKLIDVLAEFNEFDIRKIEKEKKVHLNEDLKYVIDSILILQKEGAKFSLFVEIDYTHYTSYEKIRNIISFVEQNSKTKKSFYFIVVRFSQEDLEVLKVGDRSKLFIVPWSLSEFNEVTSSLCSDIGKIKECYNA